MGAEKQGIVCYTQANTNRYCLRPVIRTVSVRQSGPEGAQAQVFPAVYQYVYLCSLKNLDSSVKIGNSHRVYHA